MVGDRWGTDRVGGGWGSEWVRKGGGLLTQSHAPAPKICKCPNIFSSWPATAKGLTALSDQLRAASTEETICLSTSIGEIIVTTVLRSDGLSPVSTRG